MKLLIDIPEHIYEHAKETTEDSSDEFDAMRAIANGTQQESRSEIPNKSEIPTSCGDAISREELIEALDTWDKFGYAPTYELIPLRSNVDKDKYVPYIHYDDAIKCIKGMPSVTPQQRTGRWIKQNYGWNWQCSECGFVTPPSAKEIFTFCPKCGAKMEVEE